MISILILTYNEEANLSQCLQSVAFSDDIVVLDSGSTDATLQIAQTNGATLLTREFDNYAAQRNYGLAQNFKNDWILILDADERASKELIKEISMAIAKANEKYTLYRMRRKDYFMGRWLKRSSGYPTWFGRLCRRGRVRVVRDINEEYHTDGEVGIVQEHLLHFPFNKGIDHWFERHNRYSSMEANRLADERMNPVPWIGFVSHDPAIRRKAFKSFAYRLPFRPLLTFIYLYFLRLGILDGKPGFHFAAMRACYEYMINLKLREAKEKS